MADEGGVVAAVCVGQPQPLATAKGSVPSGIVKRAVEGPVLVRTLGLEGDGQADLRVHGGPEKAVYCYPAEHLAAWNTELGREDFVPGRVGENLSIRGYLEDDVRQGDVFRAGSALLEVTTPRMPCYKLAAHVGTPGFVERFLETTRSGWYLRVLEEGTVAAGDPFTRERRGDGRTVQALVRAQAHRG